MMEIGGKIFVVALVLAIIFVGLGMFLFYLERKLQRIEKKIDRIDDQDNGLK